MTEILKTSICQGNETCDMINQKRIFPMIHDQKHCITIFGDSIERSVYLKTQERRHLDMSQWISPYEVGALLYTPANHAHVAESVIAGRFDIPYSLALCLEDSISDQAVPEAERNVVHILNRIAQEKTDFYCPLIFIRVREPAQIGRLYAQLGQGRTVLTGFIAPKCTPDNIPVYLSEVKKIRAASGTPVYLMPIMESHDLAEPDTRQVCLRKMKQLLDADKDCILNVRVGGNDFCSIFGLRRRVTETIHDIRCVDRILSDILAYFSRDYVVSGPVWEYFDDPDGAWREGMLRETRMGLLGGFIGKTVIHPNQISVVNEVLRVSREDYADAHAILGMEQNKEFLVSNSAEGGRMNEYKTHTKWAQKICTLAEIYGVQK